MRLLSHIMILCLVFTLSCSLTGCGEKTRSGNDNQGQQEVTLTILETSDVHGQLMNYDYSAGVEEDDGLVKCATIIKQEREKDPSLLLVDCGDMSQGNMISEFRHDPVPPVAIALNALDYDIWELGNHEFNYEFATLQNTIRSFKGTVLGGNIYKQDGTRFVKPYVIKDVQGVKVAIIGVDAANIPNWESDPSHYDNMTFISPNLEIGRIIDELKPLRPDVTIVLAHCGENPENKEPGMYSTGAKYSNAVAAFLIGHAHSELTQYYDGQQWSDSPSGAVKTCLMETGSAAKNVGKLTLTMHKEGAGPWQIKDRKVELLNCAAVAPDPEMVSVLADIHERSLARSNSVIGQVTRDFFDDPLLFPHIPKAVLGPSAITDLVNRVMLLNAEADVAISPLYHEDTNVKAGDFHYKDVCKIYPYDNTLVGVKVTGEQLKKIMERDSGSFFNQPVPGDVTLAFSPRMRLFEYDVCKGVDYEIDVSQPIGQRIQNLVFKGQPLRPEQELVLAMNDYRYATLLDQGYVKSEDVVYNSADLADNYEIRSMIAQYIADNKIIEPVFEMNWQIVGYNFDDPQKDLIYDMIRAGKIEIPVAIDGRHINIKAINAIELRREGVLPPLD